MTNITEPKNKIILREAPARRPGLFEMLWPFAVFVLVGIAMMFFSGGILYLYEQAAANKPAGLAFPTDGEMIFMRLFCGAVILISGITITGAVILGAHYAIHREKDSQYNKCVWIAFILLFLTVVGVLVFLFVDFFSTDNRRRNS